LLHADDGVLKSRCQLQRQQAETILSSSLFARVSDVLKNVVAAERTRMPETQKTAEESITALKTAFDELENKFASDDNRDLVDNLFAAVRQLPALRKSYELKTLLGMVDDTGKLLLAQAKRLQAMERAALDDAATTELVERLRDMGATDVTLERATAGEGGNCVGYWLYGEKATG
jgi:hypothetical protein